MDIKIKKENYLGLSDEGLVSWKEDPPIKGRPASLEAMKKLIEAGKADGIEIKIASGWRSFDRQFKIFDEKFRGLRPVLGEDEQPLDISGMSDAEKVKAILRFSAIPGFSRHHFGTDFDIYANNLLPEGQKLQLTAQEYSKGSYFYHFGIWLAHNLTTFGFYRPFTGDGLVSYEPWHISYSEEAGQFLGSFSLMAAVDYLNTIDRPWIPYVTAYAKENFENLFN